MNFNRIQAAEVKLWDFSAYFWNTPRMLLRSTETYEIFCSFQILIYFYLLTLRKTRTSELRLAMNKCVLEGADFVWRMWSYVVDEIGEPVENCWPWTGDHYPATCLYPDSNPSRSGSKRCFTTTLPSP